MSLTSYLWRRQLRASTRILSALIELDLPQSTLHRPHFQFHCTRGKKHYKKKLIECLDTEIQHEKDNYETDPIVKEGPPNGFTLLDMKESNIVLHKEYENEDIAIEASFVEQPLPEKENPEDPDSATPPPRVLYTNRNRPLYLHPPLGVKKIKNYTVLRDPFKTGVKYVFPKWMVIGPEGKYHHTFGWDMETAPPKDPFFDPPILEVSQTIMLSVTIQKQGMDRKLSLQCETDGGYMSITHVGLEPNSGQISTTSPEYTGPVFGELDDTLQDTFNNWIEERGIDDVLGDYLVQKLHDVEQEHYLNWLETTQSFISHE